MKNDIYLSFDEPYILTDFYLAADKTTDKIQICSLQIFGWSSCSFTTKGIAQLPIKVV